MSGEVHYNPSGIKKHADELKTNIAPKFEEGRKALDTGGGTIEGGDFSITGTLASVAYPGALQFAFQDMETHGKMIGEFAEKVAATAQTYQATEEANTIRRAGGGGGGGSW
jgi:hypothetical protein